MKLNILGTEYAVVVKKYDEDVQKLLNRIGL